MPHAGHFKPSKAAFIIRSLHSERPSRRPTFGTLLPPVTPMALTSLLQSWKMSLVRILQEESTIVCFMMLLWQVAGDESSGTWGPDGPKQSTQKDPRTLFPSPATYHPWSTWRPQTYFPGVSTLWVHFPGIPKVHRVFLHLEVAAGEVIVLDAIEIPTEATYLLLKDKLRS